MHRPSVVFRKKFETKIPTRSGFYAYTSVIMSTLTEHKGQYHPEQTPCLSKYLCLRLAKCVGMSGSITRTHTSRNDFTLCPPFTQHGEQEGQRVRDRDRKAQFYVPLSTNDVRISLRQGCLPACPINKKNHILPVTFTTKGNAYDGFLSRSTTVQNPFKPFRFNQLLVESSTEE